MHTIWKAKERNTGDSDEGTIPKGKAGTHRSPFGKDYLPSMDRKSRKQWNNQSDLVLATVKPKTTPGALPMSCNPDWNLGGGVKAAAGSSTKDKQLQ